MKEMSGALLPKHRKRSRYPVQDAFDIDIDHCFPVPHRELVEGSDGHSTGIAEENVEPTEALLGKAYQIKQVLTLAHVRRTVYRFATGTPNLLGYLCKSLFAPCTQHESCPAAAQFQSCGPSDATTCSCDRNDLSFNHGTSDSEDDPADSTDSAALRVRDVA